MKMRPLVVLVLGVLLLSWVATAQTTYNVTIRLNTSTVKDTLRSNSVVQIRGNTTPLTWDDKSVGMTNQSGDYWTKTIAFLANTSLEYKFFIGDWEGGDNKKLTVTKDTVLPIAYYNNGYTVPFTTSTDSVDVWFRVNMGSDASFNPASDAVGIRGASPLDWGKTWVFAREGVTKFYSGKFSFPNASKGTVQEYKFVYGSGPIWESVDNRKFTIANDTTLYWKTFNDKPLLTVQPETVSVKFRVNTATVPDTMRPISYVQVRGGTSPLTWGMTSPVKLTNVSGDYWEGTAKFVVTPATSIDYKFYTNHKSALLADDEHQGWENDLTAGNRNLLFSSVPKSKDTTLPLQYVNGSPSKQDQYWKPYVSANDSIAIMFRVNMQSNQGFNVGTQIMGIRGSLAPLAWDKTIFLKQETQHGNGGSQQYDGTQFWSTVVKFPKNSVAGTVYYKFVIHAKVDANNPTSNATWEDGILRTGSDIEPGGGSNPARIFEFRPTMPDTTLYWKFWANRYLAGFSGSDTVIVTFNANMLRAITENGFVLDDMLEVRAGYGGSAMEVRVKRMNPQGLTTTYRSVDTIVTKLNTPLYYQYYRVSASGEMREIYYNFNFTGTDVSLGERRNAITTSKTMTINDVSTSASDDRRMPRFRNLRAIARNVTVKFTVDARPAIFQVLKGDSLQDIQGTLTVKKADSVKKWGVAMNGPATGGWATWGPTLWQDTTRRMFDDGTHGDTKANDSIYTRLISYV
ncbi:MAG: CBM20 domain-containing protein, partial [bacterium]